MPTFRAIQRKPFFCLSDTNLTAFWLLSYTVSTAPAGPFGMRSGNVRAALLRVRILRGACPGRLVYPSSPGVTFLSRCMASIRQCLRLRRRISSGSDCPGPVTGYVVSVSVLTLRPARTCPRRRPMRAMVRTECACVRRAHRRAAGRCHAGQSAHALSGVGPAIQRGGKTGSRKAVSISSRRSFRLSFTGRR